MRFGRRIRIPGIPLPQHSFASGLRSGHFLAIPPQHFAGIFSILAHSSAAHSAAMVAYRLSMPIHCPLPIGPLDAAAFEKLDYRVMGHAYSSQNRLGRFCDEYAYKAHLKAKLLDDGFESVATEVPVTVMHRDFTKTYFLDLVADQALYEMKTAAALVAEHESQVLNYMFLLDIPRAKLLNLRPPKVQGKIIATGLTRQHRRRFSDICEHWTDLTPGCGTLRRTMLELLDDWGAFLEVSLYEEALSHFFGGTSHIERRVTLNCLGLELGSQRMLLHAPAVAFRITAYTAGRSQVKSNLRRLLALTDLDALQWINLNHAQIEFTTLEKAAR
jgi:GxxExxY protein